MRIKVSRGAASWSPEGQGTHAGVFLPLPPSLDKLLPSRGDEDPSPSHATFIYLGDVDPSRAEDVVSAVERHFADLPSSVQATASHVAHFHNAKGQNIAHLVPEFSHDLTHVRARIISDLEASGITVNDKGKTGWVPHITLAYLGPDEEWDGDLPTMEWTLSGAEVWGFPESYHVPFGGRDKWSEDAQRVVAGGVALSLPLSLRDALEDIRRAEGADPETGDLPVTETVFDEVERPRAVEEGEPPTLVAYSAWTGEERQSLLSKLPTEALHALLSRYYSTRWWSEEPEVILEDLGNRFGFILDAGGINRVRALHAICSAPVGECPFYHDPPTFRFLTLCLSGRAVRVETDVYPSPHEIAVALHTVQPIRPGVLEDDVLGFVAACCYTRGLWALPGILAGAQPKLLRMCAALGIPVDAERVERVLHLAREERRTHGDAIPDVLRDGDDVQALEVIDHEDGVQAALEEGDRIESSVIEAWNAGARSD